MLGAAVDAEAIAAGARVPRSLLDDCYAEMRRIARILIANGGDRFLVQPTELAHDAAIRLMRSESIHVNDRGHMLALAARVMRQSLIDEVRRAQAAKRQAPPLMTEWPGARSSPPVELNLLDDALRELAKVSAEHAEVVELRFTLGLTVEEAAAAIGVAERTIKRRWQAARAWLQAYLEAETTGAFARD